MKYLLAICAVLLATNFKCGGEKGESAILTERGIIRAVIYTPSSHETNVEMQGLSMTGLPTGMSGQIGVPIPGTNAVITSSTVPAQYGILFECQHGSFVSKGTDERHQAMYEMFRYHVDDTVLITYKEMYLIERDDSNKVVKKTITSYDFLKANLQ